MRTYRPDDEHPQRTPDEILAWVYERGHALRFRRRMTRGAAAAAALTVVVATAVVALGSPEPRSIRIVDSPTSEPSVESNSPIPSPSPSMSLESPTPHSSPTPELVCRNSTNPACGDFYWDPAPGPNAPLTFEIQISPENPEVGQEVTVTVTVRDPDSPMSQIYINFDVEMKLSTLCAPQERYGPWSPPEEDPGVMTKTATHTFDAPGDHYVHVLALSQGAQCGASPYGSRGENLRTIDVAPAPSPTPTDTGLFS